MPLQLEKGNALDPQPLNAPPREVAFDDPIDALPEPIILKIDHKFQEGKLWCWAACVQMVLDYYKKSKSQCKIVQIKLHDPLHQCPENPDLRTDDCAPILMAQTWRDCGIENVVPVNDPMSLDDIKTELKAHRPLEVGIEWTAGGGHAVLIKGWAATIPESLVIDDPLRNSPLGLLAGAGRATYDELLDALGHGVWQYTWSHLV